MMHFTSPIVSPLVLVEKLGPEEKVGFKSLTTEQVKAYLTYLEENYCNFDPTPAITPPNKWAGYAGAVVQAMQQNFMVTKDDYDFLLVNSGYLFHQIIAEHMGDLRSRFSIVSIDFEKQELFGSQDYQLNQECMKCNVGHQRVGLPTECNATYGPYNSELLINTTMPLDSFLAMIVGTKSLLTLHEASWETFLNLGITNQGELSLARDKMGLANAVRKGSLFGKKLGLAVCSLVIQSEHRDMGTVMNHPQWAIEPLFNHEKVCTREYYRRVHDLMLCLVNSLLPWIVPEFQRLSCLSFQSEVNDHSENIGSNTHPSWLSGDRM